MKRPYQILIAIVCFFLTKSHCFAIEGYENRVYLATFPKSGNHWVRYLIEEAVQIVTSSVYRDYAPNMPLCKEHLPTLFPWGGYCPDRGYEGNRRYPVKGDIVVVKTHYPFYTAELDKIPAVRSVRIVRHPVESFCSLYLSSLPNGNRAPQWVLEDFVSKWRLFQEYWDTQHHVLTVRYEDLYQSPKTVLKQILAHIGYKVPEGDIERAIAKYPPKGGTLKYLKNFHEEDLRFILKNLWDIMKKYNYTIHENN